MLAPSVYTRLFHSRLRKSVLSIAHKSCEVPSTSLCNKYFSTESAPVQKIQPVEASDPEKSSKAEPSLLITDSCAKRLQKVAGSDSFLRVMVDGGGCSGFEYKFTLDCDVKDDDEIFCKDGVRVVVDKLSLDYLKGSTVDYHEELIKSSFRVINNPKAQHGCSCGSSFSVKL